MRKLALPMFISLHITILVVAAIRESSKRNLASQTGTSHSIRSLSDLEKAQPHPGFWKPKAKYD